MSDAAPRDPLLLLAAYADGELSAETVTAIETRLSSSADLRNQLEDIRALQAGLRTHLPAAPRELDPARRRAVLAAAQPLRINRWRFVRMVAAACLVLGVLGLLLTPRIPTVREAARKQELGYSTSAAASVGDEVEAPALRLALVPAALAGHGQSAASAQGFSSVGGVMDEGPLAAALDKDAGALEPRELAETDTVAILDGREALAREKTESSIAGLPRDFSLRTVRETEKKRKTLAAKETEEERRVLDGAPLADLKKFDAWKYSDLAGASAKRVEPAKPQLAVPIVSGTVQTAQNAPVASPPAAEPPQSNAVVAMRQMERIVEAKAVKIEQAAKDAKPVETWRAPLQGSDLVEHQAMALQNGIAVDEALAVLGRTGEQLQDAQQALQQADDGESTVTLDLDRLSRGQALLQTARAGGRQLRPLSDGIEVAPDRRPLDPTATFGLVPAKFREAFGATPMTVTADSATLTFAFTADTASFDRANAQLRAGQAVDPDAIRAEHFVNAVPADYPPATGPEAFTLYAEAGPSPFAAGPLAPRTALVSVGAVARPAAADERRPLALTLAIDCSGSMAQPGGLDRVRAGLDELLARLGDDDSVAVVAFGDRARVVLPATPGAERQRIAAAVDALQPGGSTNAGEGLSLAYQLAAEGAKPGRESRVLLATDGATLAGDGAAPVLERIAADRARGVSLIVVGCGGQQYRGAALDALAARGDGQHLYVGSDDEARGLFRDKLLPAKLGVLARDAKVQVTWNPQRVSHARLIGFETRRLAARDFRNDAVDAGEIAHDTQATALFEVVLADGGSGPLGSAAVRYLDTRLGAVRELACPLPGSLVQSRPSPRLRLMACSATLADLLGRTWWANQRCATYAGLRAELARCAPSPFRDLLRQMADRAQALTREP